MQFDKIAKLLDQSWFINFVLILFVQVSQFVVKIFGECHQITACCYCQYQIWCGNDVHKQDWKRADYKSTQICNRIMPFKWKPWKSNPKLVDNWIKWEILHHHTTIKTANEMIHYPSQWWNRENSSEGEMGWLKVQLLLSQHKNSRLPSIFQS